MSLNVKFKPTHRTWTQALLEESEYSLRARNGKRERTFRRMYFSVFVLFGSAFLIFCSLFYVGAFIDVGKIIGYDHIYRTQNAQAKIQKPLPAAKQTPFDKIMSLSALNRVYIRKGQAIRASYSVPRGTILTLTIKQCASRPLLEIFSCKVIGKRDVKVESKTAGTMTFQMNDQGFYHFENHVVLPQHADLVNGQDYHVIWLR